MEGRVAGGLRRASAGGLRGRGAVELGSAGWVARDASRDAGEVGAGNTGLVGEVNNDGEVSKVGNVGGIGRREEVEVS